MSASGYVYLDVAKIHAMTEKAMRVELEDGELLWLPLSQCADADSFEVGDENLTVGITEWLAKEKGIEQ
jgi:hypothetical protein